MSSQLIIFFGVLFSVISLKYFSLPYIPISIFWLSLFIILTLTSKTTTKKAVWFNLAFIALLLGVLETYSYLSLTTQDNETTTQDNDNNYRREGGYTQGYFTPNEILGYAPSTNKIITSQKYYKNQLLYDATYTIGDDGRRITPPPRSSDDNQCIIFFGGSFTFGEGIDDHEAMPYLVGDLQEYKVHNYGFHGYGPHQMLSAIENGLLSCNLRLVVYQAMGGHVARSAGYSSWDNHGPKYVLQSGKLTFRGHFDDSTNLIYEKIQRKISYQLGKSNFYKKYFSKKDRYTITDYDIRLFLEIVNTSRRKLMEKFPNVEFHIILWDKKPDDDTYIRIRKGLKLVTNNIHLISNILPKQIWGSQDMEFFIILTVYKEKVSFLLENTLGLLDR